MDEYTERLLERTRARSENLAKKMSQSEVSPRKRRTPLTDVNSSDSEEKKVRLDASPVKSAVTRGSDMKPDTPAIPSVRSRMSKLADMRREWSTADGLELDSPQNVSAPRPRQQEAPPSTTPSAPSSRKSRFAALAASINNWEDDLDHPKHHFQHEEKPQTKKWERPKPVEEIANDPPPPKKDNGILSITPKKPARNVRFEDEEEESNKPSLGNGQGKAQMRSLPSSGSPARERNTSGDPNNGKPDGRAELRSLPTGNSPVKGIAYSRLVEKSSLQFGSSPARERNISGDPKNGKPDGRAELRSLPTGSSPAKSSAYSRLVEQKQDGAKSLSKSASGGTPGRKRIQVSLSREREPSRMEVQKHFAQEQQQQQPTPKPRAAPASTVAATSTATQQPKSSIKRLAPQPEQAVKKQALATEADADPTPKEGAASVKAYFGRHKTGAAPASPTSSKVEPRVGAMAKSIQDRLRQHQENWHSNDINTKIQEQRKKELDIIRQRWNHSGKTEPAKEETEKEQPTPMPRVTIARSVPEPEVKQDELDDPMEVTEDTINIGMMESSIEGKSSSDEEEEEEMMSEKESAVVVPQQKVVMAGGSGQGNGSATPLAPPREKAVAKTTQQPQETGPATPLAPPRPRRTNSKLLAEEEAKAQQEALSKHPHREDSVDDDDDADDEYDESDDDVQELDITDVLGDIDDLLDEAEQAMEAEKQTEAPAPTKRQEQPAAPRAVAQKPPSGHEARPQPSTTQSPNLYSIESFRKQGPKSPAAARTIIRSDSGTVEAGQGVKPVALKPIPIKAQIQTLIEEVSTQQSIIYQTSQALNLIASSVEYKGTRQEVEAERLLLIAAQRRQACLAEIQRLKTPASVREPSAVMQTAEGEAMRPCKGFVSIQDIRLPLKTEYILSSKQDRMCHSFFLLLRCREHVLATRIQTTVDGVAGDCLPFTNIAKFNNLDSDFVIEAFVFEMQNKRPKAAEEKSKQTFFSGLTPKKILANMSKDSRQGMKTPIAPSPGGPGYVRASSFTLVGAARLTLQSCRVNRFTLSKVPFNSPLEGTLHLKMTCHTNANVTESGWLTMFDDISGFGAWHRRWCVLSGGYISYWKYPDDENRKAPNGTVDLRKCITTEVAPISRILCARPNTFELVTRQAASKAVHQSRDTLVTKHEHSAVTTKHMLSADVKEDRIRWINALNKTLLDLRTWNRDAARPSSS
ncbi:anillin-like [Patiria miniata]|uniref:PH domain-containing protein n=1 Tax=Patiria miniata TaxID=46514 RepID=A0A914BLJ3_PATMI|nr:anillin-like [Patiria miniata]